MLKRVKDATEGIVVAGGQGQGNSVTQLSYPQGAAVDHIDNLYAVGWDNHPVQRFEIDLS